MAIPPADCAPADDTCCVWLYRIADHLLTETFNALLACYHDSSCKDQIAAYVTMGAADDGVNDALTVAIRDIIPSTRNGPGTIALFQANFEVRLRESGWPTIAEGPNDTILFPSSEQFAHAAAWTFARGEAMHAKLSSMMSKRQLTPSGFPCMNASIGTMVPLRPSGGVVGWTIPVAVNFTSFPAAS